MGLSESPRTAMARPSSTSVTMPQVSGQSCGQTPRTVVSSFMRPFYQRLSGQRLDPAGRAGYSGARHRRQPHHPRSPPMSLSRRDFLAASAAAVLAKPLAALHAADAPPSYDGLKVGAQSYSFRDFNLERALKQ